MSDVPADGVGDTVPEQGGTTSKSFRKGVFPRLQLPKVMELVDAIKELGHGDPVPRLDVYDHLGRKDGGATRTLVAAANSGYGLTTGNSGSEVLGLTERGLRITGATTARAKYEAVLETLMSNEIFAKLVERYAGKAIPIDGAVTHYLKQSHGLSQAEAEACWKVMKANLEEYGPTKISSGRLYVVKAEEALNHRFPGGDDQVNEQDGDAAVSGGGDSAAGVQSDSAPPRRVAPAVVEAVQPQFHFNIQVVLPENASPETYEAIFKNIGKHLLRNDVQE